MVYLTPPTIFFFLPSASRNKGWCVPAFEFLAQQAGTNQPLFLEAEARKKKIIDGMRYITLDPISLPKRTYC